VCAFSDTTFASLFPVKVVKPAPSESRVANDDDEAKETTGRPELHSSGIPEGEIDQSRGRTVETGGLSFSGFFLCFELAALCMSRDRLAIW
jgi:hypothetical protein